MSAFADLVAGDIAEVFLDGDFFAEEHLVAGRAVPCVAETVEDGQKRPELGLSSARVKLHAREADLSGLDFPPGGTVVVDGDVWVIEGSDSEMGMAVIELSRNE